MHQGSSFGNIFSCNKVNAVYFYFPQSMLFEKGYSIDGNRTFSWQVLLWLSFLNHIGLEGHVRCNGHSFVEYLVPGSSLGNNISTVGLRLRTSTFTRLCYLRESCALNVIFVERQQKFHNHNATTSSVLVASLYTTNVNG